MRHPATAHPLFLSSKLLPVLPQNVPKWVTTFSAALNFRQKRVLEIVWYLSLPQMGAQDDTTMHLSFPEMGPQVWVLSLSVFFKWILSAFHKMGPPDDEHFFLRHLQPSSLNSQRSPNRYSSFSFYLKFPNKIPHYSCLHLPKESLSVP